MKILKKYDNAQLIQYKYDWFPDHTYYIRFHLDSIPCQFALSDTEAQELLNGDISIDDVFSNAKKTLSWDVDSFIANGIFDYMQRYKMRDDYIQEVYPKFLRHKDILTEAYMRVVMDQTPQEQITVNGYTYDKILKDVDLHNLPAYEFMIDMREDYDKVSHLILSYPIKAGMTKEEYDLCARAAAIYQGKSLEEIKQIEAELMSTKPRRINDNEDPTYPWVSCSCDKYIRAIKHTNGITSYLIETAGDRGTFKLENTSAHVYQYRWYHKKSIDSLLCLLDMLYGIGAFVIHDHVVKKVHVGNNQIVLKPIWPLDDIETNQALRDACGNFESRFIFTHCPNCRKTFLQNVSIPEDQRVTLCADCIKKGAH